MSKKELLNFMLFPLIVAIIYAIWAIQPLSWDDWCITKLHTLFIRPPFPQSGQQIRYSLGAQYFFATNPFSFLKVWSLLAAIVSTSLLWAVFIKESIFIRAGMTLLVLLGFPYLGHIGAWNFAASTYILSVIWIILWYAVFRKIHHINKKILLKAALFFTLTFFAASGHEVWLISFAGIAGYFIFDAISLLQKKDRSPKLKSLSVHLSVVLAYMFAVAFYLRGGPSQFIDARQNTPGVFAALWNWPHIIRAFVIGTKGSLVLIKDCFPVFLLIVYIKLKKNFQNKLSSDFKLFLAMALGTFLFIYVGAFIFGDTAWRVRWLCAVSLSVAFYSLPTSILIDGFSFAKKDYFIKVVRFCCIIVVVIWLSYNAYRTYVYTNIDVVGWLQYRQMVLDRNPDVLKKLCCSTLPKNRPRGVAKWEHAWGAQDDRYRFFFGPTVAMIAPAVKAIWEDESTKKGFFY